MTSILERSAGASTNHLTHDFDIPPTQEVQDKLVTGQRLNTIVSNLADVAERSGFTRDEYGLYVIGTLQNDYIAVGHETREDNTTTAEVNTLLVISPSHNTHFYYCGSSSEENGLEVQVNREIDGIGSQSVAFSESHDQQPPHEAIELSIELAQTLVDTTANISRLRQSRIDGETLSDIIQPLTTPDVAHDHSVRKFGAKVVNRLFSFARVARVA